MVFALWGVVISAVYMLRAYRAIFLGEPGKDAADVDRPGEASAGPSSCLAGRAAHRRFRARASSSPTCSRASRPSCRNNDSARISLEIAVLLLGIFLLLAESFSKSDDKSGLAKTAIAILIALIGFSFFARASAVRQWPLWQFYVADPPPSSSSASRCSRPSSC